MTPSMLSSLETLRCVVREMRTHEDIVLLPILLGITNSSTGTFVELGAFDGISGSQTYLLERCFGWRGLLIEASPINFAQLEVTPRAPQTRKVHSAVCATRGGTVSMISSGGTVAGVLDDLGSRRIFRGKKHFRNCSAVQCVTDVPCKPLPALMEDAGLPRVNFLSLDVEGSEERVLQSVLKSAASLPFDVVMVEADGMTPAKDERVRGLLRGAGMRRLPLAQYTGSVNELYAQAHVADPRRPLGKEADAAAYRELKAGWLKPALRSMPRSPYLVEQMNITTTSLIVKWLMASMPDAFEEWKRIESSRSGRSRRRRD